MSQIASAKTGQNRRMLLIVSILTVCFFAVSNLPWNLDDYDQAKQAFVSFQMIGQQRCLYQTTPDEGMGARGGRHSSHHINSKPPAVAWVSAALYQIALSWDFAWRFPSFVAAIALPVLVFRGARTFGDLPALCALAAFGLNLLSVRLATLVRTDMPLALITFAVGLLMFEQIRTRTSWTTRDQIALVVVLAAAMFWLITWALGGIVVMSLVSSKRVDRIFPAVPPLCMLLAAQIKAVMESNGVRVRRILASAIIFAAIFTGTYAAMRVIGGYRYDRDALVKFGREVRRIATAEHLRYEILPGRDESLLLYLQRPRFYTRIETIAASPGLDALVVPIDEER